MASNGRLPASALAAIGGGYYLRRDAARAFNAMSAEAQRRFGTSIRVVAGYRTYERQVYFWNLYLSGRGNLAAHPGTSNHGWGIAVDLASPQMRRIVDQIGAKYGFSKAWSDAPTEWWHVRFKEGVWHPAVSVLKRGSRGERVKQLQRRLRQIGFKSVPVDGHYGLRTERAVKRFQRKHHLPADGVAGPKTISALRKV